LTDYPRIMTATENPTDASVGSGSPLDGVNELIKSLGLDNPLATGARAVDQARRSVDALIASMELFVQSMDNINQVAARVNRLLDDIEGPLRQTVPHVSGALSALQRLSEATSGLNDLARRLGPLGALFPQQKPSQES
jgi:ABC-type transporter Mla subunit MlaD